LARHERGCASNPANQKACPVCEKPFMPQPRSNGQKTFTCSRACANTHYRSGSSHPNWKPEAYRSTCFEHHEKKCCVCGEELIVEVHHMDENHSNTSPENLVPLCPTHHQYWHSRHRSLIEEKVRAYINRFVCERVAA
jgi:5-methylcytosine-specific restriction endonuclease McrA